MKVKVPWCNRKIRVAELGTFLLMLGMTLLLVVFCLVLFLMAFVESVILAFIGLLIMAGGILMMVDFVGTLWKDVFR